MNKNGITSSKKLKITYKKSTTKKYYCMKRNFNRKNQTFQGKYNIICSSTVRIKKLLRI